MDTSSKIPIYLKKNLLQLTWLGWPIVFFSAYALWVLIFKLLTLSFITYFTISPTSHFQDISDAFSSNEVSLMGLSAFIFISLLHGLNPMTSTSLAEIITRERIERSFLPGFVQGAFFAGGMILAFLLSGVYRYLGYFIQLNEAPLELANVVLRMASLGALAYCEEFIFRHKLPRLLRSHLPELVMAHGISVAYCIIKLLQFNLGIMHLVSLYLVSLSLFYRGKNEGQFSKGAGFWAAILVVFQPLLSLPIFGNDFSGILLVKYQSLFGAGFGAATSSGPAIRLITGGTGGPVSGLAFQLLLILDIGRSIRQNRVGQKT